MVDQTQLPVLFPFSEFKVGANSLADAVCFRLEVRKAPGHCIHAGDGSARDLTGASQAGMTAAFMQAPYDLDVGNLEGWEGA